MPTFYTVTSPHKTSTIKPLVVVLAPGMGGDRTSPGLGAVAKELSTRGIMTVTFDFPYRLAGKKAPDSPKVLLQQYRDAIDVAVKKCAVLNSAAKTINVAIGGRSMGGRIASEIATEYGSQPFDVAITKSTSVRAKITACLLLSYPLHAPGKTERKDKHFADIKQKCLFASGDRDPFATPSELKSSAKKVKGKSTVVILKGGDHELKTRKADDVTFEELNHQLALAVASFL
jgi:predicted alpha/beta-hydrolase family hydrolase